MLAIVFPSANAALLMQKVALKEGLTYNNF